MKHIGLWWMNEQVKPFDVQVIVFIKRYILMKCFYSIPLIQKRHCPDQHLSNFVHYALIFWLFGQFLFNFYYADFDDMTKS